MIAHRGFSTRAPENTLAALRLAIAAHADAIEWDVHTASCGTPVLFHDASLGRTTNGVGPVRRRTLAQLKALDAGSWFGDAFAGERIPTLDEGCALLVDTGYTGGLFAEIKGWRELEDVDRMIGVVAERGLSGRTTFIALDWTTLDRVSRVSPASQVAFVVEREERFEDGVARAKAHGKAGVAVDYRILLQDTSRMAKAAEAGVPVGVWTVEDLEIADRLYALGVRDFTTNDVDMLLRWKAQLR